MKIRIAEEKSRLQLPDDINVPASLRPHRELTEDEIRQTNWDVDGFMVDQVQRRGRWLHVHR